MSGLCTHSFWVAWAALLLGVGLSSHLSGCGLNLEFIRKDLCSARKGPAPGGRVAFLQLDVDLGTPHRPDRTRVEKPDRALCLGDKSRVSL